MEKLSILLKKLRKGRKLSQKELCNNIMSQSYYSKVEHNESSISFDLLTELLNRMNIPLSEFSYLLEDSEPSNEFDKISGEIYRCYYYHDFEAIKKIKHDCDIKFAETEHIRYQHLSISASYLLNNFTLSESEKRIVLDFFMSYDDFTFADMIFFANLYKVFENDVLFDMFKKMKFNINKYIDYSKHDQLALLLLNLLDLIIKDKRFELLNEHILELRKYSENDPLNYFLKLNLKYYEELEFMLTTTSKKELEKADKRVMDIADIFDFFDNTPSNEKENGLKATLIKEFTEFKKSLNFGGKNK